MSTRKEHVSTKPTDSWRVADRVTIIKNSFFPDFFKESDGTFAESDFTSSKSILDIACGRGAIGRVSRALGFSGELYGLDKYDYLSDPETPTAYNDYSDVIVGNIKDHRVRSKVAMHSFDLIISMCTNAAVFYAIAKHKNEIGLLRSGKLILISELPLGGLEKQGFRIHYGQIYGFQISVYKP